MKGRALLILMVALVATNLAGSTALARDAGPAAKPKKQPAVAGFFRGRTIRYFDFGPIKLKPGNKLPPSSRTERPVSSTSSTLSPGVPTTRRSGRCRK